MLHHLKSVLLNPKSINPISSKERAHKMMFKNNHIFIVENFGHFIIVR